jgi:hypothetical protein
VTQITDKFRISWCRSGSDSGGSRGGRAVWGSLLGSHRSLRQLCPMRAYAIGTNLANNDLLERDEIVSAIARVYKYSEDACDICRRLRYI